MTHLLTTRHRRGLALSPGPLRGGERAWYTLNAHASTLSIKFAVKLYGYYYPGHMLEGTVMKCMNSQCHLVV